MRDIQSLLRRVKMDSVHKALTRAIPTVPRAQKGRLCLVSSVLSGWLVCMIMRRPINGEHITIPHEKGRGGEHKSVVLHQ